MNFSIGHGLQPGNAHEVSELQIALGLAAAATGVCVVPYAASRHRTDLLYRVIDDEHATSPPWLDPAYNTMHGQHVAARPTAFPGPKT